MNDHDAMTAINAVLDQWMKGKISEFQVLFKIATITGENSIDHAEAKKS